MRQLREPSPPSVQAWVALASLAEAWLRDATTYVVVLLALAVVPVGLDAGGVWAGSGVVLGPVSAAVAVLPTVCHWRPSRTWFTLFITAITDAFVIRVMIMH